MKFGVALPNCTEGLCYPVPFTSPELVVGLARTAERLGFDEAAATLDVFSGGRLILGVGVGAYREELEAVLPRVATANRAEMIDEGIEALNCLMEARSATFVGTRTVGTPSEVIDKIERFSNVGVTYCASLAISGNSADDVAEQMQRFAEEVMPHFAPTPARQATA